MRSEFGTACVVPVEKLPCAWSFADTGQTGHTAKAALAAITDTIADTTSATMSIVMMRLLIVCFTSFPFLQNKTGHVSTEK